MEVHFGRNQSNRKPHLECQRYVGTGAGHRWFQCQQQPNLHLQLRRNCARDGRDLPSKWPQTFGFDSFGNIVKSGNVSYSPSYTTANHATSFTYDSVGNVTNDAIHTYSYDFQGRPVTVDGVQVIYDAFGRVAEVNNGGTVTQILYQPDGSKFATMHGHANLVNYFVPMAGGMVEVFNPSGVQYVRHADWLGSSRLGTTPAQAPVYDRSYAPYGEPYGETATTDRSFTGQTQDTKTDGGLNGTTGLYDFLYRQDSPAQGRWLVPDPAGLAAVDLANPQTWNRYAYVGGNPLSRVDPLGLDDDCGGPCTSFVLSSVGNCMTVLNYYKGVGEDGQTYDMPYTTSGCTGGGGGTKYKLTVAEWDDIHSTRPCTTLDCIAKTWRPAAGSGPASNVVTATFRTGEPGQKKAFCDSQSNKAFVNALLPGFSNAIQGNYKPIVATATSEITQEWALDAASKSTPFLLTVRSWMGIPMSITSKVLSGIGYVGIAVNLYDATKAMQTEYAACMQ